METKTLSIFNAYPTHITEIHRPLGSFGRRPEDSLVSLISTTTLSQSDTSQKEKVSLIDKLANQSREKIGQIKEECQQIYEYLLQLRQELPEEEQLEIFRPMIAEQETTIQTNYVYTSFRSDKRYDTPFVILKEIVLKPSNSITPSGFMPDLFNGTGRLTTSKQKEDTTQTKTYEGEFDKGIPEGFGLRVANQKSYSGQFSNGKRHGYGTETDGTITYKGQWENGKPHGFGERKTDTATYVGCFKNGHYNGYGILKQNDDVYEGFWEEGILHKGVIKGFYEGELKELRPHGQGETTLPNGEIYKGDWENGVRQGNGTLTYPQSCEEDTYVGQFKNDQIFGKGTMQYRNGNKYYGEWKNGFRDGQGTLFTSEGTCIGKWENNIGVNITYTYTNGPHFEGKVTEEGLIKSGKIELHGRKLAEFQGKWADGQGKLDTEYATYEGEFKDNKLTGTITITYKDAPKLNGSLRPARTSYLVKYVGEIENWVPHGRGIMLYNNYVYKIKPYKYPLYVKEYSGEWKESQWTIGKVTLTEPLQNEKEPPIQAIERDWKKPLKDQQVTLYYSEGEIFKYTGFVSPPSPNDDLFTPGSTGFLCIPVSDSPITPPKVTAFKQQAEVSKCIMYYSNGDSIEKAEGLTQKITKFDDTIITGIAITPTSGKIAYPNGDIYEGRLAKINEHEYLPEGHGTMTYAERDDLPPSVVVRKDWKKDDKRENFRN